jgi:hypothetical protein
MMTKKIIVKLLTIIILTILFIVLIPIIRKGIQVKKLENLKLEYAHCEQVLQDTHIEADKIREKLGLTTETQSPQRT